MGNGEWGMGDVARDANVRSETDDKLIDNVED